MMELKVILPKAGGYGVHTRVSEKVRCHYPVILLKPI